MGGVSQILFTHEGKGEKENGTLTPSHYLGLSRACCWYGTTSNSIPTYLRWPPATWVREPPLRPRGPATDGRRQEVGGRRFRPRMFLAAFHPTQPSPESQRVVDEATVDQRHAVHLRPHDATAYSELGQLTLTLTLTLALTPFRTLPL